MQLIEFTSKGLYCPLGKFHIDPWQPVDLAVTTHAHSDHASLGSKNYLCHPHTKPLLHQRLGEVNVQALDWEIPVEINGVTLSFHPAGHIIGSSQVRLEYRGEVWVFSGDYKLENDGLSGQFEPVPCHTFITESTFGLPIYKWHSQQEIYASIQDWVNETHKKGKVPVITGYSLGKAQRLIDCVGEVCERVYAHGAVWNMQDCLVRAGVDVKPVIRVSHEIDKKDFFNAVVVAPPGAEGSTWLNRFTPWSIASCSGWMQVRGNVRRKNVDAAFALSDHADWEGLLQTVEATGASRVYVTHGFQDVFSRYLNEKGIESFEVKTAFKGEEPPPPAEGEEEKGTEKTSQE